MTQKYCSASVNLIEVLSEYRKQTQPFWIDFHCLTRCKMLDGMQPILLLIMLIGLFLTNLLSPVFKHDFIP